MTQTIFLSYTHSDGEFAKQLAASLQAGGHKVWMDIDISTGEDWDALIQDKISEADVFLMILGSKAAQNSPAVYFELGSAMGQGKPVIPVLIGTRAEERLPTTLRDQAIKVTRNELTLGTASARISAIVQNRLQPSKRGLHPKVGVRIIRASGSVHRGFKKKSTSQKLAKRRNNEIPRS